MDIKNQSFEILVVANDEAVKFFLEQTPPTSVRLVDCFCVGIEEI